VLHHDVRVQRGVIDLDDALVESDLRLEDEPATVAEDELLRALERLRQVFLPEDGDAVLVREVRLHRGERRAGRESRLLLWRQCGQPRELHEPREPALPHRKVPAVQVEASLEQVLARLVHDLPVREVRFRRPPPVEPGVAAEPEVDAQCVRLFLKERQDERVAAVREHDVRVVVLDERVDPAQHVLLVPVDGIAAKARAEEAVVHPRQPGGRVHRHVEHGAPQVRDLVLEREVLLERAPRPVVRDEPHREDPVLQEVPLRVSQVDVEQLVLVVPARAVHDPRGVQQVPVVAGDDLEERLRGLRRQTRAAHDDARGGDLVEDLEAAL